MRKVSKRMKELQKSLDCVKSYSIKDAVATLKSLKEVKFNQTLDIAINLAIDTKHSDQMVRGTVQLPFGTGKNVRVAVICKSERTEEAKASGAEIYGSEEVISDIKSGKIDFDVCIATPDMMGLIGPVAKILGPRGLMPNPKLGTVTMDISLAVKKAKSGQIEFRADKAGVVHAGVGKISFENNELEGYLNTFISAISNAKPSGVKGSYIKSIYLSSTMSPSIKLDTSILSS